MEARHLVLKQRDWNLISTLSTRSILLLAGHVEGRLSAAGVVVELNGERFEVIEEFIYFGPLITWHDMPATNRTFYILRSQLKCCSLQTRPWVAHCKTVIFPMTICGRAPFSIDGSWSTSHWGFERKILQSMFDGEIRNWVCHRHMNHELYRVYKFADIVKVIQRGKF